MKERFKAFLVRHRKFTAALFAACAAMSMGAVCFAAEGDPVTFDLTALATSSAQKIVNDLLSMISSVVPILIILMGASIGIAYTIKFIKKITKTAG